MAIELLSLEVKIVGEREGGRSFTLRVRPSITVQKVARAIALKCSVQPNDLVFYRCQQALQPGSVPVEHTRRLADLEIVHDAALDCVIVDQVGRHGHTYHMCSSVGLDAMIPENWMPAGR
jgi:hypothetical protein